MAHGEYTYPADEFDSAAARVGPQGVHRSPRSRARRWAPFLLVLVIFPVLAFGLVTWLSSWDGLPGSELPALTDGTGTQDPADPAAEDPAAEDPAAEESPAPDEVVAEPTEPVPPPPVADLTRTVEVFNSTPRAGLAASAAERVEGAGFTDVTAGNWQDEDPPASVVYYPAAADVATAQAVADALGITVVTESAGDAGDRIVVVLATDFEA